ncbi:MAG: PAS domain S-box protein [archaeon]
MKEVLVSDIMSRKVIACPHTSTFFNAAHLMSTKNIGCMVITQNKKPIGIITERDVVRLITQKTTRLDMLASAIMSKPVKTIAYDSNLAQVGDMMLKSGIRRLIVKKGTKFVGIVTETDLIKGALLEEKYLKDENQITQDKFSTILSTIPNGMDMVDESLNILYMNDKFLKIFGKKAVGKKCYSVYKDNKKQCMDCPLKKPIKIGETKTITTKGVAGNRTFEITHTGLMYNGKKAIMELFIDATERIKIQDSLITSEKRFKDIAEDTCEWIWEVDPNGLYTYSNSTVKKILGYNSDEIIGKKHFYDFFEPKDRKELKKAVLDSFSAKEFLKDLPNLNIHKNGTVVWLSTTASPIIAADGKLIGYRGLDIDITAQKRSENKLRQSEAKYKSLFETSADAILTLEPPTWKFTSGNPATVKLFRTGTEEKFTTLGPWEVSPKKQPDGTLSAPKAKEMIIKAMKEGSNFFEWTHKRYKGEKFPATVLLTRLERDGRQFLQATVRDITEQKKAEEELINSRNLLQRIIDLLPIRIFWKDMNLNYLGCNLIFAKDAGKNTPDDLINKDDFKMGWKKLANLYRQDDRKIINSKIPKINFEEPQTTPNGDIIWLKTSKVPLKDIKGKTVGILGSYEDITKQKKDAEAIQREKEFSEKLIETAPGFVVCLDKDGHITRFNQAAENISGYKKDEVLGKNWFEKFISKKDYNRITDVFKNLVINNKLEDTENNITLKNGKQRIISWANNILRDDKGIPIGVISIGNDITEKRKNEEEKQTMSNELNNRIEELEKFQKLTIDRELKMIEQKKIIEKLTKKISKDMHDES